MAQRVKFILDFDILEAAPRMGLHKNHLSESYGEVDTNDYYSHSIEDNEDGNFDIVLGNQVININDFMKPRGKNGRIDGKIKCDRKGCRMVSESSSSADSSL